MEKKADSKLFMGETGFPLKEKEVRYQRCKYVVAITIFGILFALAVAWFLFPLDESFQKEQYQGNLSIFNFSCPKYLWELHDFA